MTETFDSGPGQFIAGPGGPAGPLWHNENLTLGASGPGEIGGVMTQTPNEVWMADPTIGPGGNGPGLLTLNDPIQGSGEFYIGEQSTHTNGAVFIGHMTTAFGDGNELGVQYSDGGSDRGTFWLGFKSSSQTGNGEPTRGTRHPNPDAPGNDDTIRLPENTAYRFTYDYDPTTRVLFAEVFEAESGISRGTVDLTIGASVVANFTAWGAEQAGTQGSTQLRLDNVTYTTGTPPPTPTWQGSLGGSWTNSNNWLAGILPNGAGAEALFGSAITAPRTVYADSPVTLGKMTINNPNMYVLAGAASLTMQGSGSNSAMIDVQQGTQKINLPLVFASNTTLQVASGATLLISDPTTVNAGKSVTQSGGGTVQYQSTVDVLGGGSIQFGNSSRMAGITLASAASATVTSGANKTMKIGSVDIAGGKFDLKDNKLVTAKSAGTASGGVYNGLQRDVQTAYAGGAWTGNGLTTSMPQAADGLTTIGVATGEQIGVSSFGGQPVAPGDSIAFYTYAGDTNFDGMVSGDDYGTIDFAILVPGSSGYYNGDFNYDGVINGDDYGSIDFAIIAQGAPFPTSSAGGGDGVAAVPEPTTSVVVVTAGLVGCMRRRRHN